MNGEDASGTGPSGTGASGGGDPASGDQASQEDRADQGKPAGQEEPASQGKPASREGQASRSDPASREDHTSRSEPPSREDHTSRSEPPSREDHTSRSEPPSREDHTSRSDPPGRGAASQGGPGSHGEPLGDEVVWQDLIARFDLPADPAAVAPWPDREGLIPAAEGPGPPSDSEPPDEPEPSSSDPELTDGPGFRDQGPARDTPASHGSANGVDRTRVIRPASPPRIPASASLPPTETDINAGPADTGDDLDDNTEEHYIPPPPPPLPHLDSVAKGAWTAVFGGPGYLLLATLVGWTVPGWAALLAVAAFIGGFAVVVLRLGDGPSRGSGPDNGAVL